VVRLLGRVPVSIVGANVLTKVCALPILLVGFSAYEGLKPIRRMRVQ